MFCIGRRNTGKSTLLSLLVEEKRNSLKNTLVMCGTPEEEELYSKLDNAVIYNGYTQDILYAYMEKQGVSLRTEKEKESVCVVLDNLEHEDIWKDVKVRVLVMNNRNLRTFVCGSSSSILFLNPAIRSNVDYLFLFKETNKENLERLYSSFGGIFETYEDFCATFDTCTKTPYGCMVIDNTSRSHRVEDIVFMLSSPATI